VCCVGVKEEDEGVFLFLEHYSIQIKGAQKGPKSLRNELGFMAEYVDMIDTIQEVETQDGRVEVDHVYLRGAFN
jgi:hypothetical protein